MSHKLKKYKYSEMKVLNGNNILIEKEELLTNDDDKKTKFTQLNLF